MGRPRYHCSTSSSSSSQYYYYPTQSSIMPSSWLFFSLLSFYHVLFLSRSVTTTPILVPNEHHSFIIGAVHGFVVSPTLPSSSSSYFVALRQHHSIATPKYQTTTASSWSRRVMGRATVTSVGGIVSSNRARRSTRYSTFLITNDNDGEGDSNLLTSSNSTSTDEKQIYNYYHDKDETSSTVLLDDALKYLAIVIEHRLRQCKSNNMTIIVPKEGVPPSSSSSSKVRDSDDVNLDRNVNVNVHDNNNNNNKINNDDDDRYATIAKGRFIDLTTTIKGEQVLENLFIGNNPTSKDNNDHVNENVNVNVNVGIVQLAITTLQSLLIYGMQIGVKGSDEVQLRTVRHLFRVEDDNNNNSDSNNNNNFTQSPTMYSSWSNSWDEECIRKLKYQRNTTLAKLLLGKLKRKRTSQGAFNLLLELGVWQKHEEIALLRSGFPIQLTTMEKQTVNTMLVEVKQHQQQHDNSNSNNNSIVTTTHDADDLLGIRQDLRHLKVYTIDGESTNDIDDGISVEILENNDNSTSAGRRYRYWIHIADVDRWSPRGSDMLKIAERRGTSLYLPSTVLYMFPEHVSSNIMSLTSNVDKFALSLGVELLSDGTIDTASLTVKPSLIHVNYQLTYDQVNEMLDEGVGYTEEWEIGTLLSVARIRRAYRISRGSTEGMVPCPIPKSIVTATKKKKMKNINEGAIIRADDDEYDVSLTIETTHNSGLNTTSSTMGGGSTLSNDVHYDPYCSPISSSQLIVTEMMILGESKTEY